MNIAMLVGTWVATNGVVTSVKTFRRGLERPRKGGMPEHRVLVIAPGDVKKPTLLDDGTLLVPGRRVVTKRSSDYFVWQITPRELAEILRSHSIELIHVHHLFQTAWLGITAGRKLGIPVVGTYHTYMPGYTHYYQLGSLSVPGWIAGPVSNFATRVQLNQLEAVVTPSPPIADILREWGVRRPISAIPTGVDIERYRKPASDTTLRKLGIDPRRPTLTFVGRLAPEKNYELLLQAFDFVHHVMPEVQLVLIGPGPDTDTIKAWVTAHKLTDSVVLTGGLPPEQTWPLFGRGDIFVFPSLTDTQGIVVVEAMAAGIPVIAANYLGPSAIVIDGKTGYLLPNSFLRFGEKIIELLADSSKRTTMGKAGFELAHDYEVAPTSDAMLEFYKRAIAAYHKHHRPQG